VKCVSFDQGLELRKGLGLSSRGRLNCAGPLNAVFRIDLSFLFRQSLTLEKLHLYTLSRLKGQLMGALVD
jgi:hypothetical protein